jgi:hypothetical protein
MNAFDTFTPAMFEAMRLVGKGAATAKEIGSDSRVLNALCDRGMLKVDHGKPNYYTPTPMGIGAIAVLNSPIRPKSSEGPVAHIQRVVAHYFGIPLREMTSGKAAPGGNLPCARTDALFAPYDRQAVRQSRSHNHSLRHPENRGSGRERPPDELGH